MHLRRRPPNKGLLLLWWSLGWPLEWVSEAGQVLRVQGVLRNLETIIQMYSRTDPVSTEPWIGASQASWLIWKQLWTIARFWGGINIFFQWRSKSPATHQAHESEEREESSESEEPACGMAGGTVAIKHIPESFESAVCFFLRRALAARSAMTTSD